MRRAAWSARSSSRTDWPNRWDRDEALQELNFLDDPESTLPDSLPLSAQALARRVQLAILCDELGSVAHAIRLDGEAKATISPSAAKFAAAVEKAQPLSENNVVPLFEACDIGTEKIGGEQGSDLLAQTVTQTLAVSTSAISGTHAGLPAGVQRYLRALRGFALVLHLFVSRALAGTRASGTVAAAMLAAGATLVGVGLFVRIPGILLVAGVALMLGGIVLAAYRHSWQIPWKAILIAAVLAMGVRIAIWVWDAVDDGQSRPGWVALSRAHRARDGRARARRRSPHPGTVGDPLATASDRADPIAGAAIAQRRGQRVVRQALKMPPLHDAAICADGRQHSPLDAIAGSVLVSCEIVTDPDCGSLAPRGAQGRARYAGGVRQRWQPEGETFI